MTVLIRDGCRSTQPNPPRPSYLIYWIEYCEFRYSVLYYYRLYIDTCYCNLGDKWYWKLVVNILSDLHLESHLFMFALCQFPYYCSLHDYMVMFHVASVIKDS
jgi:hypothetical protein